LSACGNASNGVPLAVIASGSMGGLPIAVKTGFNGLPSFKNTCA
jgi:hypothetical protein